MLLDVYSDDGSGKPQYRLAVSEETAVNSTAGWQTIELIQPILAEKDTTIWLSWVFESNPGVRYTAGTPGRAASGQAWAYGMPATFGSSTAASYKYSICANYTVEDYAPQVTLIGNPYMYTARAYDIETGLYYYRARYYNPHIGRFLQVDPARYGMNWYAYCGNNSINFVDPTGLYDTYYICYNTDIRDPNQVLVTCYSDGDLRAKYYKFYNYGRFAKDLEEGLYPEMTDSNEPHSTIHFIGGSITSKSFSRICAALGGAFIDINGLTISDPCYIAYDPCWGALWGGLVEGASDGLEIMTTFDPDLISSYGWVGSATEYCGYAFWLSSSGAIGGMAGAALPTMEIAWGTTSAGYFHCAYGTTASSSSLMYVFHARGIIGFMGIEYAPSSFSTIFPSGYSSFAIPVFSSEAILAIEGTQNVYNCASACLYAWWCATGGAL